MDCGRGGVLCVGLLGEVDCFCVGFEGRVDCFGGGGGPDADDCAGGFAAEDVGEVGGWVEACAEVGVYVIDADAGVVSF